MTKTPEASEAWQDVKIKWFTSPVFGYEQEAVERARAADAREIATLRKEPDFGLLTRRVIQRVVKGWPHFASDEVNYGIEAELRQAWNAPERTPDAPGCRQDDDRR